jgi:putative ABC transport system permease protein
VNLLVGSLSVGLILALLALGTVVTYRVLNALDLTTDGSFGAGAATTTALIARGQSPILATLAGLVAGAIAGLVTGLLHTRLRLKTLLAGILTSTALYSVILYILGGGDLSIAGKPNVYTMAAQVLGMVIPQESLTLFGTPVSRDSIAALILLAGIALFLGFMLDLFFRSDVGLAMRAVGDNAEMASAQSVDVGAISVLGVVIANMLIALSGSLFAQFQGFANVQMGIGMVVNGLASALLGESVVGTRSVKRQLAGAIGGAVAFRLSVAAALKAGLDPTALKLLDAIFLLAVLVAPRWIVGLVRSRGAGAAENGS